MKRTVPNVAVIGCGYWGSNLIRNFSQIEAANMYYVCDTQKSKVESIQKMYPTVKATMNFEDVIKRRDIDAVVIATPVASHSKLAKEALLYNKHVLVEKPMTASVREAEDLIRTAEEKNRILMVDHTFEYAQAIIKIKEIIESGEIGNIYYARAEWLNLGILQPDVNVIWDLATHIISIMSYILGVKAVSLNANANNYLKKDIPEIAHIYIKFQGRIALYMTVSWLEPKKTRTITIVGDKKALVYDLTNMEEQIKVYDKGVVVTAEDMQQLRINYRYGDIYSPNIKNIEPLQVMCSHFADCITNNKAPRSDGLSGLNVVKVLEATEESLRNNGKELVLK